MQTTGLPPVQTPFWHVSVCVQAFESLQGVPGSASGKSQVPLAGLQTPAWWHWSGAGGHGMGAPAVQTPPTQMSPIVQALLSSQDRPSALEKADVLMAGLQVWHGLAGLGAPASTQAPLMKHQLGKRICEH